MTFITTILRPGMVIRQNYSSPTPTLPHMKLQPKIFTKIAYGLILVTTKTNHPSGIKRGLHSKVLGMFKDEAGGEVDC